MYNENVLIFNIKLCRSVIAYPVQKIERFCGKTNPLHPRKQTRKKMVVLEYSTTIVTNLRNLYKFRIPHLDRIATGT